MTVLDGRYDGHLKNIRCQPYKLQDLRERAGRALVAHVAMCDIRLQIEGLEAQGWLADLLVGRLGAAQVPQTCQRIKP